LDRSIDVRKTKVLGDAIGTVVSEIWNTSKRRPLRLARSACSTMSGSETSESRTSCG
jgi:hypothetical protein